MTGTSAPALSHDILERLRRDFDRLDRVALLASSDRQRTLSYFAQCYDVTHAEAAEIVDDWLKRRFIGGRPVAA